MQLKVCYNNKKGKAVCFGYFLAFTAKKMAGKKTILIIDANSVIHRAFHALPELTNKRGEPIQAVYGFALAFLHIAGSIKPDYVAACFDTPKPTFRHKEFDSYKAHRPPTAENLAVQFPKVKDLLKGFGVAVYSMEGYEADDIIATIVHKTREICGSEIEATILTGDYDSLQLVGEGTKVFLVTRGVKNAVTYGREAVLNKFGVGPEQIVDFKALSGDASDNFGGAPGIGKKTAAQILKHCGSIDKIYEEIGSGQGGSGLAGKISQKAKEILLANKEQILMFKRLALLDKNSPIDFSLQDCEFKGLADESVGRTLESFGFLSLAKRLTDTAAKRENGRLF